MSLFNKQNIVADKLAYGKWASLNSDYFANPKIIKEFYSFFKNANISLKDTIEVIDLGGAEGMVGEFFSQNLSKEKNVNLTILDVVKEHLEANKNPKTKKICVDLLDFKEKNKYDLGIMSSVLHYFSKTEHLIVLKNIRNALTSSGVFLLKAFTQFPENMDLFHSLNRKVGKNLKLITSDELKEILKNAGFSEINFLGNATTWNCTGDHLKKRYQLSEKTLKEMSAMIDDTPKNKKNGFTSKNGKFSIPIPYRIYLLRK